MENNIQENIINNNVTQISLKAIEKINSQIKKSICLIKSEGKKYTGFFCKILYKSKLIPVLVTNSHILCENYYKKKQILNIISNNEEKSIKIDRSRNIFIYTKFYTAFIEIIPNIDKIKMAVFLEEDDKINKEKFLLNKISINEPIYIIHHTKTENNCVSYTILSRIKERNILLFSKDNKEIFISPILSLNSFKVIGINYINKNYDDITKGTFIKYPFNKFDVKKLL